MSSTKYNGLPLPQSPALSLPSARTGRKHNRRIALEPWSPGALEPWQQEYHFTNHSEDILGIFTAALDSLGIHWRRSTTYVVSSYRETDTARMDEFIGPKAIAVPWSNVHYTA